MKLHFSGRFVHVRVIALAYMLGSVTPHELFRIGILIKVLSRIRGYRFFSTEPK